MSEDLKIEDLKTPEEQFQAICDWEHHAATSKEKMLFAMLEMSNKDKKAVADGTISLMKFDDIQHALALKCGAEGTEPYEKRRSELNTLYWDAKKGKKITI